MKKFSLLILSFLLLGKADVSAQTQALSVPPPGSVAIRVNAALKSQSGLYNGRNYNFYDSFIEGSGYFMDKKTWEKGSVVYDGFRYDNVPLLYDLNLDLLASLLPDGQTKYSFLNEKLREFYLLGHHFVWLSAGDTGSAKLNAGFYDQLYTGKIKVFARRTKALENEPRTDQVKQYFSSKVNFYLEKDNQFYTVNSESAFLSHFKAQRNDLKKYLKDSKIRFKKEPEKALVLLASRYEQLTN